MGLIDVINAVTALVPSATHKIGPQFIDSNDAPPRVVWIPSRDSYGPPRNVGGNPRQFRTRFAGCEVRVWGADYAATEAIVDQVQAACFKVASSSFTLDENAQAGWLDTKNGDVSVEGRVYVFHVAFHLQVTEAALRTATLTSLPQTVELNSEPV